MLLWKVCAAFALLATAAYAELLEVEFPSGEMFYPVGDPASLGAELQDPKNTGSELYDSQGIENVPLSLNFEVSEFKSPTNRYFRAHPALMDCLQRTYNVMRRDDETVEIAEGYRTSADSPSDAYLQSGAAAVIQLNQEEGGAKTMQDLAAVVIEICVPIFQEVYGDIGLVLYSDKLHVRLQGAVDTGPHFSADSGASMDTAAFEAWALGQIDEAYEPIATPECEIDEDEEEVPTLASGGSWPAGETVESACGTIDYPVTRNKVEDFKRLVQYPANNIVFENEERSGAWCGSAERGRCVDCSTGILGSGLDDRCADRVMTKSMLDLLRKVQKMVKDEFTGVKLKVLEAWDEPHAGATEGDQPAESLHFEGRAAKLTLTDGDTSKLPQLAKNAICAGANFVEHKGDHIFVAVRKQLGFTPTFVDFPENTLISVRAPAELEMNYTLPDEDLSNNNNATMPMLLFDSDGKWGMNVGANVTVDDFKDPDARYFRLNPVLVECYEALALRENKWKKHDEVYRNIKILEGYLTTEHQDDRFNMSDPRYDRHNLGWAMRVGYYGDQVDDPEVYTPLRLAKFAVIKCGPLFADNRKSIGVGMYNRSVFVDIRDDAKFWVDEPDVLPVNVTAWDWADEMAMLLEYAIEGRIIEPDSLERACLFSDPTKPQSVDFQHRHSEAVQRRRRRRRQEPAGEEECIPTSDTEFCAETAPHRETEIAHIWQAVKKKHLYRAEADVKAALEGCFGACGTCLEGEIWEEKTLHCNNFLHWVNFDFLNSEPDITNFWARDNTDLKVHACRGHCIVKAPIFSLLAPSTEELYRPDPTKSPQEQIYSMANNPLPVMDLMQAIYGMHANGRVEFYVEDEAEMQSLRASLKSVLVFNKNVTEVIVNAVNFEDVEAIVQNLVFEWTKSSCPDDTREFITPFSVVAMPAGVSKRSPEHEVREMMLERHRNWEHDWISRSFG
ncbi:PREDICTED: uncharacterized protein LOC109462776 isoform X2 [Branchiostoma belcheri]|uniref:Uncharacterized protein LOC109462776 isoform X2 n=1 Tax=Branchiostoma belcheri TaxID=7741 RepID=A0A6P4XEF6_BRABE|nr:PREDICTED: uncharacterized protein LOC109462776 isoform X2 [Branchiostoma belcheri]